MALPVKTYRSSDQAGQAGIVEPALVAVRYKYCLGAVGGCCEVVGIATTPVAATAECKATLVVFAIVLAVAAQDRWLMMQRMGSVLVLEQAIPINVLSVPLLGCCVCLFALALI